MNTNQLIVLWLGVLSVASLLAARLGTEGQTVAAVLITGTLIYSLGSHPNADRRKVALSVGIAAVCGIGTLYAYAFVHGRALRHKRERADESAQHAFGYPMDSKKIQLFDVRYSALWGLRGRVENDSGKSLTYLALHVAFRDGHGVLDEGDCWVWFSDSDGSAVAPGETRSFTAICPGFDVPWHRQVSLNFHVKSAMAAGR